MGAFSFYIAWLKCSLHDVLPTIFWLLLELSGVIDLIVYVHFPLF